MKMVNYTIEDLHNDPQLFNALMKLFQFKGLNNKCRAIVESGTYLGTGTTKTVIDALLATEPKKFPKFYTVEASEKNFLKAKDNLKDYPWVEIIHGTSVNAEDAIEFMKNDDALQNHELYPDILIDDLVDPVAFYTKEVQGQLFGEGSCGEDDVFARILPEVKNMNPLIVLDGAGGIGWFEFIQVREAMQGQKWYLMADDVAHLKHFRTYNTIKASSRWKILAESDRWALAVCEK